jgi:hypothetical protein
MENLDSTVIVTALPQMTLSFGVTAYTLTPAVGAGAINAIVSHQPLEWLAAGW